MTLEKDLNLDVEKERKVRLCVENYYLAIFSSENVRGCPNKFDEHTLLVKIRADKDDLSLVYIYGIKSGLYLTMVGEKGHVKGVKNKSKASIFKEQYAQSWIDNTVQSVNYLTYECMREKIKTGWFISVTIEGSIRNGSHSTKEFICDLAKKTNDNKIIERRQAEMKFLQDCVTL
ncbi:uncharacterized protein LOC108737459 isoform X1 [Agrilus planipennis]|uniref:Uncharacterized protein LOC108737459 isoform X1 n=1 Tax=Agrilus planipennis TaxID=224129 RepID=A0A7F5RCJ5_AGRPL|nr:uncharacterized protein LOC108737459 isoform X1 [Agrilus planipennis]